MATTVNAYNYNTEDFTYDSLTEAITQLYSTQREENPWLNMAARFDVAERMREIAGIPESVLWGTPVGNPSFPGLIPHLQVYNRQPDYEVFEIF